MEEFEDFEGYMNKVEVWGMRGGIVKVIPLSNGESIL